MCTPIGGKNPKPNFCINPYSLSMKIKPCKCNVKWHEDCFLDFFKKKFNTEYYSNNDYLPNITKRICTDCYTLYNFEKTQITKLDKIRTTSIKTIEYLLLGGCVILSVPAALFLVLACSIPGLSC